MTARMKVTTAWMTRLPTFGENPRRLVRSPLVTNYRKTIIGIKVMEAYFNMFAFLYIATRAY